MTHPNGEPMLGIGEGGIPSLRLGEHRETFEVRDWGNTDLGLGNPIAWVRDWGKTGWGLEKPMLAIRHI